MFSIVTIIAILLILDDCINQNVQRQYESPFIWGLSESSVPSNQVIQRSHEDIRISVQKCSEYTYMRFKTYDYLMLSKENSIQRSRFKRKGPPLRRLIAGGRNAKIAEFPHMAAIGWHYYDRSLIIFKCGGSLISEKFVLTASHCTSIPSDTNLVQTEPSIVRLGALNLLNDIYYESTHIDKTIKTIIRHPKYKSLKKYYDIALIELNETVLFNPYILPACLWSHNDLENHTKAIVTGWGSRTYERVTISEILQKATLDLINDSVCDSLMAVFRNRHWQGLHQHQMCAGVLAGGKDTCPGDSGGPLQISLHHYPNVYSIIGVTSFGRQCAKPNQPGIYTKVSYFLDWIESIVWSKYTAKTISITEI